MTVTQISDLLYHLQQSFSFSLRLELPEAEVDKKKEKKKRFPVAQELGKYKACSALIPTLHHSCKHIRTFRNSHTSHPHACKSHPSTHRPIVKPQNRKQQAARKTPKGLAIHCSINLTAVRADARTRSHALLRHI